ncbi:MAG: hypothetical protein JSV21_10770 [Nitrospirota bacterium]|nr:MAG: hypothetical protein JSV21_10770 [Nitrospirota bacterium]
MKTNLWVIIIIVVIFLGFMMGYAVPPFMEVGFGKGGQASVEEMSDEELKQMYENLYKEESDE